MPRLLVLAVLLVLAHGTPAAAQDDALAQAIDAVLEQPPQDAALWGVWVADVEQPDSVLYARNAQRGFVPASTAKLVTTAAALETLGPDFRYRTGLYHGGAVRDSVLHGPLVVRGAGDPSLNRHFHEDDPARIFRAWGDSLRALGVRAVDGDVVGDDDLFLDDEPLGKGWAWDDVTYGYSAEVGALTFYDNVVRLAQHAQAPGQPAALDWEPAGTRYVSFLNRSETLPYGARGDEEIVRATGANVFDVQTTLPAGATYREELAVVNPTRYFTFALRETLVADGLPIDGAAVDVDVLDVPPAYETLHRVATYTSPPLAEIVTLVNEESHNLGAELLLRTLGAMRPVPEAALPVHLRREPPEPGSVQMGRVVAEETLARAGADTARVELFDASGLSRMNIITPSALGHLLAYMATHDDAAVRDAFRASLPANGRQGTMRYRVRDVPDGNVIAKTGTLTHVSGLAGLVRTRSGRLVAFALLANNHATSARPIRRAQDAVVELLYERL